MTNQNKPTSNLEFIMPKNIWVEERKEGLEAAIKRCEQADMQIPEEWEQELRDLDQSGYYGMDENGEKTIRDNALWQKKIDAETEQAANKIYCNNIPEIFDFLRNFYHGNFVDHKVPARLNNAVKVLNGFVHAVSSQYFSQEQYKSLSDDEVQALKALNTRGNRKNIRTCKIHGIIEPVSMVAYGKDSRETNFVGCPQCLNNFGGK